MDKTIVKVHEQIKRWENIFDKDDKVVLYFYFLHYPNLFSHKSINYYSVNDYSSTIKDRGAVNKIFYFLMSYFDLESLK